jgi:hypothetical protein
MHWMRLFFGSKVKLTLALWSVELCYHVTTCKFIFKTIISAIVPTRILIWFPGQVTSFQPILIQSRIQPMVFSFVNKHTTHLGKENMYFFSLLSWMGGRRVGVWCMPRLHYPTIRFETFQPSRLKGKCFHKRLQYLHFKWIFFDNLKVILKIWTALRPWPACVSAHPSELIVLLKFQATYFFRRDISEYSHLPSGQSRVYQNTWRSLAEIWACAVDLWFIRSLVYLHIDLENNG